MRFRTFLLLSLLLAGACRSASHREALSVPGASTVIWVDAAREGPGDGSRDRPLQSLGEALARPGPLTVRLAPGRYEGPFVLPPGARLEGLGTGVVLHAGDDSHTVLKMDEGGILSGVVVQGGQWGLEVTGGSHVRLERVGFSGQRTGAVRVESGRLDVEASRFEAAPTATVGILLESKSPLPPGSGAMATGAERLATAPEAPGTAPRQVAEARADAGADPGQVAEARADAGTAPRQVAEARADAGTAPRQVAEARADAGADPGRPAGEAPPTGAEGTRAGPESPRAAGEAHIRDSTFTGPYRRAVRLRGADMRARLEDVRFSGPATAVGVDGAHAEVLRSSAEGGQAAAFSVMSGTLILDEVTVTGHEYGLSAMQALRLEVHRFTSVRAQRAGMGVSLSRARLRDIVVRESGSYGGLQFLGGDLDVQGVRVEGAGEYGLMALRGKLRLRDADIRGVRTADNVTGDGLHLRQVEADVEGVVVREAQGACVLAAQAARVSLRGAKLEACGDVGLMTDTLARLDASSVKIDGAASALKAHGGSELRVESLDARGLAKGFAQAECEGGTQVLLKDLRSEDTRGLPETPCVQVLSP
ncbi:hypothetical protein [Corallococcus macrosporus]|uniref:hypothetical protein n=1 Tax=Corallococcus macrosporus TaxID=35 RepID=UPI001EFDA512|nr:hypothetical protein [Corallococcus macrosporus]